ncbi:MAG: zinc ABC transporter substrate-binding protein [Opitutaceae bacterium]|nr:zinc ABC transporter substrate-binding protein [Opitutaceae bacterium]
MRLVYACLGFLACSLTSEAIQIIASNTLLEDMAREVALPEDQVTGLLPLGVDPHAFQPTPKQMQRVEEADVLILNGLGLEPWLERATSEAKGNRLRVTASDGIDPLKGNSCSADHDHADHDHAHAEVDPHAWHDLANVLVYVGNIEKGLAAANPTRAAEYAARASAYKARIRELDTEARARMAALPPASRRFVTSHDSLAYFGRAYGIEIIAIAGLRPDREPSARQMTRFVSQVRDLGVRAVFIESTSNPKIPRLLAAEAGVKVVTELHTDSLGPKDGPAGTFLGLFRANLDTLERSLK